VDHEQSHARSIYFATDSKEKLAQLVHHQSPFALFHHQQQTRSIHHQTDSACLIPPTEKKRSTEFNKQSDERPIHQRKNNHWKKKYLYNARARHTSFYNNKVLLIYSTLERLMGQAVGG
jgi:hypothetical protein